MSAHHARKSALVADVGEIFLEEGGALITLVSGVTGRAGWSNRQPAKVPGTRPVERTPAHASTKRPADSAHRPSLLRRPCGQHKPGILRTRRQLGSSLPLR